MLTQDKLSLRAQSFLSPNLAHLKHKREYLQIELRKLHRTDLACKRRAIPSLSLDFLSQPQSIPQELTEKYPELDDMQGNEALIVKFLCDLLSRESGEMMHWVILSLRSFLASNSEETRSIPVSNEYLPLLISHLSSENALIVFNTCWCLTNITAGTQETARLVVNCGFFDYVERLLAHKQGEIVNQTIWTVSNVIGEERDLRNEAIQRKFPETVYNLLKTPLSPLLMSNSIWLFSNLSSGLPYPPPSLLHLAISTVPLALLTPPSPQLHCDICALLVNCTNSGNVSLIQSVLDLNIIPVLKEWMESESSKVVLGAIKVVGNLMLGMDAQVDRVVEGDMMDRLERVMDRRKRYIRKEVLWMLSNVAAGSLAQMRLLFRHSLYSKILQAAHDPDLAIQHEATMVFVNATRHQDLPTTHQMLDSHILPLLFNALESPDSSFVISSLSGLHNLLLYCKTQPDLNSKATSLIDEIDGIHLLEQLQGHKSQAVFNAVSQLLDDLSETQDTQTFEIQGQFQFS